MVSDIGSRYALCVGIDYDATSVPTSLDYGVSDAKAVAALLEDQQRGKFEVTLLTEAGQTTRQALEYALEKSLTSKDLKPEDMVVIYLACHGMTYGPNENFCFLPSDARLESGIPDSSTVLDIYHLARWLANAKVKNIVFLLDTCYSGGASSVLQHLDLRRDLSPDANLSIIAAAQWDQPALESGKVQHGLFTDCLLQACEQKPTRDDGWLTIKQIGSFLTENIKFYKTVSQIRIPEISISVSELLIAKNPRYSPQSLEFYKHVQKLLELVQYKPIDMPLLKNAPAGFYIAELAGIEPQKCGIFPYYNDVVTLTKEEARKIIDFFEKQTESLKLEKGMLVTKREVSNEIRDLLPWRLKVQTEDSLLKNLIAFEKYLRNLVEMYETPSNWSKDIPLSSVYIRLQAEGSPYDQGTHLISSLEDRNADGNNSTIWQGDLEDEVRRWLTDPKPGYSSLALLAGYGSGKTTFCHHMAAMLAQEYLEASRNGDYTHRIPLWIPLLNFANNSFEDLDSFLLYHLTKYCKVDNPSPEALLKMAKAGLIFFMLDGFDEMASRADANIVQRNMTLLKQLEEIPLNKVLLTTRPEYLIDRSEEQRILGSFPRLSLQLLNDQQVALYLQKRVPSIEGAKDWQYYQDKIQTIHDLSNLVQRPVLLDMIVKTLPTLIEEGKVVNRPNLYQRYLEMEIKRQQFEKQRLDLRIDSQQRFLIIERIALELYWSNLIGLTSSQIRNISIALLTAKQRDESDGSLREILACSFLDRTGNTYHFSHPSFLDYLIAHRLAQDIPRDDKEIFGHKRISPTIQDFLLEFEVGTRQRDVNGVILVGTGISFNYKTLENWFSEKSNIFLKGEWVSSNAISILVKLMPHNQFCKLPLIGADLRWADLSGANLRGIDFCKVIPRNVVDEMRAHGRRVGAVAGVAIGMFFGFGGFAWSVINGIMAGDTTGAAIGNIVDNKINYIKDKTPLKEKLNEAFLIAANLSGADLRRADLSKTGFSGANLSDANLSGANLSDANLSGANLSDANLSGANLSGADLSGANLSGADLSGASLVGTEQVQADLSETDLSLRIYLFIRGGDPNSEKRVLARISGSAMSLERTDMREIKGLTREQLKICQQRGAIIDNGPAITAPSPSQDESVQ